MTFEVVIMLFLEETGARGNTNSPKIEAQDKVRKSDGVEVTLKLLTLGSLRRIYPGPSEYPSDSLTHDMGTSSYAQF
jgi:hypothetical protein